jgi:hypothetical protein
LGVLHQEPVGNFVALTVLRDLGLEVVNDGHWQVGLLSLSLLVGLNNGIALLKLSLVSYHLVGREWEATKVFEDGRNVSGG